MSSRKRVPAQVAVQAAVQDKPPTEGRSPAPRRRAAVPFDVVEFMEQHGHERLAVFRDRETGLRAVIAIHDTTLGPGLGGTRVRRYASNAAGIQDVLRLAEGMTNKAAVAGLPLGGGKAVILADGKEEHDKDLRAARFQAFGRCVDSLNGSYITAEDVGTSPADMRQIHLTTRYVVGTPRDEGGCGDPSPSTAYGVVCGMRALAADVLGRSSLEGVRIAVQGLGHVGLSLVEQLVRDEGAEVVAADVRAEVVRLARERLAHHANFRLGDADTIHLEPCDIFAPCAFGAILNPQTIPQLRCRIVAGAANNQLEDEDRDSVALQQRGIAYAVDYVINSGGLIHVAQDLAAQGQWSQADDAAVKARVAGVHDTVQEIQALARAEGISTVLAARRIANARIQAARAR
jgi:leucine dehydrogenase